MKTIVISSQKGGSGKTTLTQVLAVEAERAGDGPVWLIDTDQQGGLTRWHGLRQSDTPHLGEMPFKELASGLKAIAETHHGKFCLIDTAPAISDQSATIIALADLVLIPVQTTADDLWSVSETIELVKRADKPFRFVITRAKAHTRIAAQSLAALSQFGPIMRHFVAERVAYPEAKPGGNTAPELAPKGVAAAEIEGLWQEVKTCFNASSKSAKE